MNRSWLYLTILFIFTCSSACGATLTSEKRKLLTKKPLIEKIMIKGNTNYPEKTIRKKLYSREDGFWQSVGLMRPNRLAKINLYRDKVLLDYFYRSQGFIDAVIDIDFSGGANNGGKGTPSVTVSVTINEGVRYRVGDVSVSGDLGRDDRRVRETAVVLKKGEFLNNYLLDDVKQEIKTLYANSGYPYAVIGVALHRNPADSTVDIAVDVVPSNLVVFGDVIVDTTLTTQKSVFDHEIVFKRGEIYRRDKFFESQQRLIRTNLFSYVTLATPDSMSQLDSLMPNFRVTAIERPPRFINLGVGAAQEKEKDFVWTLSGSLGNRNLSGTARKVRFESATVLAYTDSLIVRPSFQFSYTEPYLFSTRLPLTISAKYEPRAPSLVLIYSIRTITLGLTALREFSLYSKLGVTFDYEQAEIFLGDVRQPDSIRFRDEVGISVNRRLRLQLEQDTRPLQNKLNPSSGAYTSYGFEYVGGILGGDNSFVRLIYNWNKYNVFARTGVFASRLRLGWVTAFGASKSVPSKERFYLGGAYTIRGFAGNDFAPRDSTGKIYGGEAIGLINLELRKPLFTLGWPVWGSFFIDSGFNIAELKLLSWRDPVITGGVGTQLITPFGPVRLDYAQRATINHVHGGGMFHISILYAF